MIVILVVFQSPLRCSTFAKVLAQTGRAHRHYRLLSRRPFRELGFPKRHLVAREHTFLPKPYFLEFAAR
jgi:hypothetical protein